MKSVNDIIISINEELSILRQEIILRGKRIKELEDEIAQMKQLNNEIDKGE